MVGTEDPPSLDELARRYLDLWQDQWAAMVADPDAADTMARLYDLIGQQAAAWLPLMQAPLAAFASLSTKDAHDDPRTDPRQPHDAEVGAEAAGNASAGGTRGLAELDRRLAAIEERLNRLEADRPAGRAAR